MRLLLIRHGETVDNVAGVYAGTTDSALTNHGVLQANRLGSHLSTTENLKISHIFSSDLQRAVKTAEAIRVTQSSPSKEVAKLELLREQDFGFYEGKPFYTRNSDSSKSGKEIHLEAHRHEPGFKDVESKESMGRRVDVFLDEHLVELFEEVEESQTVVVVAHGIILSHLWRGILRRFHPRKVTVTPGVGERGSGFSLEYLGGWSNTGYLDLEIKRHEAEFPRGVEPLLPTIEGTLKRTLPTEKENRSLPQHPATSLSPTKPHAKQLDLSLLVRAVNELTHLKGLKKTRGGLGSLKHDSSQKTVDSFFKKRKVD